MKIALWKYGSFTIAFHELRQCSNIHETLQEIPFVNVNPISNNAFVERRPFDFIQDLTPEECQLLGYATNIAGVQEHLISNRERINEVAKQNTREYLVIDFLDIYVATSMRELEEFTYFKRLLKEIFEHDELARLRLRYFDPTVTFCENRISKGLLEALMLERAKLTLYVAGERDTFGKDSECAATLVAGKPVVVYIEGADGKRKESLDKRAKLFKELHPLGLQVCHNTGVANGVIVVRNPKDCREVIRDLLLHSLDVTLDKQQDLGFVLRETKTQSILRVAVDDPLLVRSFSNFYSRGS